MSLSRPRSSGRRGTRTGSVGRGGGSGSRVRPSTLATSATDFPEELAGEFLRQRIRLPSHLEQDQEEQSAVGDTLMEEFGPNVWQPWRDLADAGQHLQVEEEDREHLAELKARMEAEMEALNRDRLRLAPPAPEEWEAEEELSGNGPVVIEELLRKDERLPVGDHRELTPLPPFIELPGELLRRKDPSEKAGEELRKIFDLELLMSRLKPFQVRPLKHEVRVVPPSLPDIDLGEILKPGREKSEKKIWSFLDEKLDCTESWRRAEEQMVEEGKRLREEVEAVERARFGMVFRILEDLLPMVVKQARNNELQRSRMMEAEENREQARLIIQRHKERKKEEKANAVRMAKEVEPKADEKSSFHKVPAIGKDAFLFKPSAKSKKRKALELICSQKQRLARSAGGPPDYDALRKILLERTCQDLLYESETSYPVKKEQSCKRPEVIPHPPPPPPPPIAGDGDFLPKAKVQQKKQVPTTKTKPTPSASLQKAEKATLQKHPLSLTPAVASDNTNPENILPKTKFQPEKQNPSTKDGRPTFRKPLPPTKPTSTDRTQKPCPPSLPKVPTPPLEAQNVSETRGKVGKDKWGPKRKLMTTKRVKL